MNEIIKNIEAAELKAEVPVFNVGDTVKVYAKIKEGNRERILPAMVMMDAISRLVPGVLHNEASAEFESFQGNLLEHPHYSRPEVWHEKRVPEVLLSGHHANIEKWRREQSILRTYERRPDLLEKSSLTWKEKKWLEETVKEKTVHEEPEDVTECTN